MEFKLNMDPERRTVVHTDKGAYDRALGLGNAAGAAARGAYGRVQTVQGL